MSKRIAILCHGQAGDALTISSVLKYHNELWGDDCTIVWFIADENKDLLAHQDVELRTFPRGYGYPEMVIEENRKLVEQGKEPIWEDWLSLVDENNHLNLELAKNYPSLAEFDYGYFPAPHQIPSAKRFGVNYDNCAKMVFGIPDHYEWHPVLTVTKEEEEEIDRWLPKGRTLIAIESFCGSGQSILTEQMIKDCMIICRDVFGECYFIFVSHKFLNGNEVFPQWVKDDKDVYFASHFTVRQCAYVVACCQLMLSVSSGISVAASCWQYKDSCPPIVQYCGSEICSTKDIATSRFELITADFKSLEQSKDEFTFKVADICNEIKQ